MSGTIAHPAVVDSRALQLVSQEARLLSLLDAVETAVVVSERSGRVCLVNAQARELLSIEIGQDFGNQPSY